MWIDSHCHLNHEGSDKVGSIAERIENANNNGVEGMLTVCCNITKERDELKAIAAAHKNIWYSIGTHPHDAADTKELKITQKELSEMVLTDDKIIAIGETGLDYYYDNSPREEQRESFRKHIRSSLETELPLIIHTRDAEDDTVQILKEEGGNEIKAVLHCFTGTRDLAEQALDMGFYISFSGIVTFKNSTDLQEVAKMVPNNRFLVETDAPFLAPVPYRGKTNQPAHVIETGKFISQLKAISEEDCAKHSKDNFFNLFNGARKTWV
ncbi:MAG: TatD family hydrolase [Alphaproteobacteria bacterium]|nr:TatD family hydrolase [Alphaproteobacteria bacterium]